jgi:hypothetical protein
MSDPWDDDPVVAEPWEQDLTVDEAIPAGSKSERTLRNLSMFGGRFDPVGAAETGLAATLAVASILSVQRRPDLRRRPGWAQWPVEA